MISKMGEAIKNFCSAHQKKIRNGVLLAVLLGMIFVGAQAMFQVKGVVTGIDGSQVTVSNFLRTQTVELAGAPVAAHAWGAALPERACSMPRRARPARAPVRRCRPVRTLRTGGAARRRASRS